MYMTTDLEFAIDEYNALLRLRPNDIELWSGKAMILQQMRGGEAEELTCYNRLLQLAPMNFLDTHIKTTECYLRRNQKQKAIEFCDGLIEQHHKEAWSWYLKGLTLYNANEFNEAVGYFDEALKINNTNLQELALYWKMSALTHANRHEEAFGMLNSFPALAGKAERGTIAKIFTGIAHKHKAIGARKFWPWGRYKEAKEFYEKAKKFGTYDVDLEVMLKDDGNVILSTISGLFTGGITGGMAGFAVHPSLASILAGGVLGIGVAMPLHLKFYQKDPGLVYALSAASFGLIGAGIGWAIGAGGAYTPCDSTSGICSHDPLSSSSLISADWNGVITETDSYGDVINKTTLRDIVLLYHVRGAFAGGIIGTSFGLLNSYFAKIDPESGSRLLIHMLAGAGVLGWALSIPFGWGWGGIGGGLLGGFAGFLAYLGIAEMKK